MSHALRHADVHPTASVGDEVRLADGVSIGAGCVVRGDVTIGPRTAILAGTMIDGHTTIGRECRIGPYAVIGADPQHRAYDGEPTHARIGDRVTIREFATVHRATRPGPDAATRIEADVLMMVGSHVAHDCRVESGATLANNVQLGGHVTVGRNAFLGGGVLVHQFCRVGRLAMIGGGEVLTKDAMPFGAVMHRRHKGYNVVGLRRAGLPPGVVRAVREAYRILHDTVSPLAAADRIERDFPDAPDEVRELIDFIRATKRGIQQYDLRTRDDD